LPPQLYTKEGSNYNSIVANTIIKLLPSNGRKQKKLARVAKLDSTTFSFIGKLLLEKDQSYFQQLNLVDTNKYRKFQSDIVKPIVPKFSHCSEVVYVFNNFASHFLALPKIP
jgi:hypothetical protein